MARRFFRSVLKSESSRYVIASDCLSDEVAVGEAITCKPNRRKGIGTLVQAANDLSQKGVESLKILKKLRLCPRRRESESATEVGFRVKYPPQVQENALSFGGIYIRIQVCVRRKKWYLWGETGRSRL